MGGDGLIAIHGTGTGRAAGAWDRPRATAASILSARALAVAARYARSGTPVLITRR